MPKYIIKEGSIERFIEKVFDNIIKKNRQKNIKALKHDPKLKDLEKKAARAVSDFQEYMRTRDIEGV
jgi:hypothetical protein|tara:strand:+ start:339 stop:539 length:201 start_codon:yes stop_codon:yes gene_type:complete